VADIGKPCVILDIIDFHSLHPPDPLTEDEISAIDKAGAKGPPLTFARTLTKRVALLIVGFGFYELFKAGVRSLM
jgi:hypothetical protein